MIFTLGPGVKRRTMDGGSIYALSAAKISRGFAPFQLQIPSRFPAASNTLALHGGNGIFAATLTERITHYTLQAKSCAKGVSPLDSPTTKRRYAPPLQGDISPLVVSSPFRSVCVLVHSSEIMFPEKDVRFVAINDGVDSDREDNDFTPFRNIINEWYAKDTSKKIRAVFKAEGMSGKRLNTQIPYGYLKGEDGTLLEDRETAPVVRLIFQLCAEGNGPGKIARMLRDREIITPGTLAFQRHGHTARYDPEHPCHWNESSVSGILGQREYLGHTVNFKTTKKSYKSKKIIFNPKDEQVVFENTHKALIDQETWDIVQMNRQQRRRPTKMGDMGLFSGLVYCADCGNQLHLCRTTSWERDKDNYVCGTYKRKKGECSAH